MKSRRDFIKQSSLATGGILLMGLLPACNLFEKNKFDFDISLAQWSLHKALFSKEISALDFPLVAKQKFEINAVEYVNQFFKDKANDQTFLGELKKRCQDNDVKSLLIMIDGEGDLSSDDENLRKTAVENHYKWVEAAAFLNCHSIRVNLHGSTDKNTWMNASAASLHQLSEFASQHQLNILVENHGGFSSNGKLVADVIKKVNHSNCGTLPDFGNFCVRREKGDLWESPCVEWYDRYEGVKEMLPYAKGVSAKSLDFDKNGNETGTDFRKMLSIVKDSGFKGYIGVEYEGNRLSEEQGIQSTIQLLKRVREELK